MQKDALKAGVLAVLLTSIPVQAGTWGEGVFENDAAADWLYELEGDVDPQLLRGVFEAVPAEGFIGAWECQLALAAGAIVQAMVTGQTEVLPNSVRHWAVARTSGQSLQSLAAESVGRCMEPERSELAQLWQESDGTRWERQMEKLRSALPVAR